MTQVNIKRVYEPASPGDGYRVLVDKLWPRGLRKEQLQFDLWAKQVAPSTALRQWYHQQPQQRWGQFRVKYMDELTHSPAAGEFLSGIKGKKAVTLLYAARNGQQNHALVLQEFLNQYLKAAPGA